MKKKKKNNYLKDYWNSYYECPKPKPFVCQLRNFICNSVAFDIEITFEKFNNKNFQKIAGWDIESQSK